MKTTASSVVTSAVVPSRIKGDIPRRAADPERFYRSSRGSVQDPHLTRPRQQHVKLLAIRRESEPIGSRPEGDRSYGPTPDIHHVEPRVLVRDVDLRAIGSYGDSLGHSGKDRTSPIGLTQRLVLRLRRLSY
jgi:hypothetical protein